MSGQVPSGDKRLTLNVKRELHRKLKHASVITDTTMGEIIEKLIQKPLDDLLKKGLK